MSDAMIACADPRAGEAGLAVLQDGGNAADAAIAAAAALNVVDFANTGIGGDMFALVWMASEGRVAALNGSGRAPTAATREHFIRHGFESAPLRGPLSVTVPGALDGWQRLLDRFGRKPLSELLQPAIALARDGFAVNQRMVDAIAECEEALCQCAAAAPVFLSGGKPPEAGALLRQTELANTLETIARDGIDAFYHGAIADAIDAGFDAAGGLLQRADLAAHTGEWVAPLACGYRNVTLYETPPNTQGLALIEQMNILEGWDLAALEPVERITRQIEAKRVSFADREAYITDPAFAEIPVARLMSKEYAAARRQAMALNPVAESTPAGAFDRRPADTTYLAVVDHDGNCVSFINSLFYGMGSCFMAPDTGILFQNRGAGFSLEANHVNRLEPRKRTMHTLNPLMVFHENSPYLVMGTIGGDQQTAGSQQALVNHLDLGMDIEQAVAAPRWRCDTGRSLYLEPELEEQHGSELAARGYTLEGRDTFFGGAQVIRIDPRTGERSGASDHRVGGKALRLS